MNENNQKQNLGSYPVVDLFQEWILDDTEEIRSLNLENKAFQGLREKYASNWEIVETCREILFLNARCIQRLKERIDDTKTRIKELIGV